MKNYLPFFFLIGVICFACSSSTKEHADSVSSTTFELPFKPNILWLVAEDLGPYMPSFGDSTIQTPTLSRLAEEGVCYDQFYAAAPVCAPARAAIATGMYPTHIAAGHMRTGGNPIHFPEGIQPYEAKPPAEAKMMSEYLRMEGYYCTNNAKEDYQFKKPVTAWDESGRTAHWRNRKSGQPFFAIFNFEVTHESRIWGKANDSLWIDPDLDVPVPPYLPDNEIGLRDVRRMYSNIKEMDHQVGQKLAELEEAGLLDSTIVFWYTDHGGPLPRQKRLLYDSGLKVPMIIRFPEKWKANTRNDDLISFIDLAPTVLSLINIKPKTHFDGRAFLGAFKNPEKRSYIHAAGDRFDALTDRNRAVRDKRYKYIRYYMPEKPMFLPVAYREQMAIMRELHRLADSGELTDAQALWFRETKPPFELFDTQEDPHEVRNVADDQGYAKILLELSQECDRWTASISDRGLIPEQELLAQLWPDGNQPVTSDPEVSKDGNQVSIQCNTAGASIGYQWLENADEIKTVWQVYTGPVQLMPDKYLRVVAHRIGYKPSAQIVERF
jgi:arylsulfatase A-like enzyme